MDGRLCARYGGTRPCCLCPLQHERAREGCGAATPLSEDDDSGRASSARSPGRLPAVTEPPEQFRALVADKDGDAIRRSLTDLSPADLHDGDVTIKVGWSSVNYKDALAVSPKGRVARAYPLVPGIDLA